MLKRRVVSGFGGLSLILSIAFGGPVVGDDTTYTVTEETPSLCTVGIYLYGRCSMLKEIVEWNGITDLNRIALGQKLTLKKPPTLTPEQGKAALLRAFRKKFELEKPEPGVAEAPPKEVPPVAALPVEQVAQQEIESEKADFEKLMGYSKTPPKVVTIEDEEEPALAGQSRVLPPAAAAIVRERVIEEDFDKGKGLFEAKRFEEALDTFQLNRKKNPKFLPAWIFEIRTLQELKREADVAVVVNEMVVLHPQTKAMPLVQPYLVAEGSK